MSSRKRGHDEYYYDRRDPHHHSSSSSSSRRDERAYGGPSRRDGYRHSERSPRRERDYRRRDERDYRHPDARRRDRRSPEPAQHLPPPRAPLEEGELPYEDTTPAASSSAQDVQPSIDLDALLDGPQEEPDVEALLAEKRRKRAEIMAKYASTQTSREASASAEIPPPSPVKRIKLEESALSPQTGDEQRQGTDSPEPSGAEDQATFDLAKHEEPAQPSTQAQIDAENEISAANYNPDEDRKQDALRQLMHQAGEQPQDPEAHENGAESMLSIEVTDEEEADKAGDSDEDDMFAMAFQEKKDKPKKTKRIRVKKGHGAAEKLQATGMVVIDRHTEASLDDADDAEGYYRVILGEVLDNGRYHVHSNLGKGMFSSVVRAKDREQDGKEVAIKIIRSQETMYKAGQKEVQILNKLNEADPHDKKHMIRLLRVFEHRNHLCLVFESMALNLREVVKRYGKDVGLNLKAVRAYAHQMFLGLNLMKKCNLMHADLKPDNVLVNENHSQLKISDLGSASDTSENDITPYLVSRFYRAPEIILGMPYDTALDMWSIGCTLYELYTGKILFPGRNNNQMLLHIQELKGRFNNKFLKKARFADQHFDELGKFITTEVNKSSNTESVVKLSLPTNPKNDLKSRLAPPSVIKRMSADEAKSLTLFVDLLDKALDTDPAKRLTPKDALNHPFLR